MANLVIARFRDGRMLKGTTINFSPTGDHFHVRPPDAPYGEGTRVSVGDLKAVFFVRDLAGNPLYKERKELVHPPGYGRRVLIDFVDGEQLVGIAHTIDRKKPGFFVFPGDPSSNNERIFAVFESVRRIEEIDGDVVPRRLEAPAPPPAAGESIDPFSDLPRPVPG